MKKRGNAFKHGDNKSYYIYVLWCGIKDRCYNKNSKDYKYYGGRGISIYSEWLHDYVKFKQYIIDGIGERPTEKHSIDRINNNDDYKPGNLRWATVQQQRINRRVFKSNKSGYVGIHFSKFHNKWASSIRHNKKGIHIGYFDCKSDAVNARNKYIIKNDLPHKIQKING